MVTVPGWVFIVSVFGAYFLGFIVHALISIDKED